MFLKFTLRTTFSPAQSLWVFAEITVTRGKASHLYHSSPVSATSNGINRHQTAQGEVPSSFRGSICHRRPTLEVQSRNFPELSICFPKASRNPGKRAGRGKERGLKRKSQTHLLGLRELRRYCAIGVAQIHWVRGSLLLRALPTKERSIPRATFRPFL